ncbi:unnamed protein product [Rotaria sordida]|uniref:Prohibitin n=1 Tax=Rotaria sordida TaxID=392033 RepID=A0A815J6L9_9BILA|nr:unnamed protein product [Rotaria sordida]
MSQFDAIELITQHTLISQRISELLIERAAQFGLLLDDISITHLSFRPEFTSAVELNRKSKSIRIKFVWVCFFDKKKQMGQSRQANVIAAEGDAHTADLIGKALDEAGLIELRQIEAAEGIANQLSKSRNSVYLPHDPQMLLNIIGATAHFQLVLSRDQGFSRRRLFTAVPLINQYPIGSILLENPYNALRKSPDLLHWYQKMKLTSAILHDFSLGGHMASLAFTKWPDSPSRQFYENKASQTFYDYLRERNRSIDSNKIVLDLIKDMMHLLMDEFTSLYNYSRSVQSNISNAMFIACTHDGYVMVFYI